MVTFQTLAKRAGGTEPADTLFLYHDFLCRISSKWDRLKRLLDFVP